MVNQPGSLMSVSNSSPIKGGDTAMNSVPELADPARFSESRSAVRASRREGDGRFVVHHVVLDRAFKHAHAIGFCFAERFLVVPLVMRDTVDRNHHARAIRPALAMHEDRAAAGV